jgi:hypothetical protein
MVTLHPEQVDKECTTAIKIVSSVVFELPRDPLVDAHVPGLIILLTQQALVIECKPSPGKLKLIRFNSPGNPIPFTPPPPLVTIFYEASSTVCSLIFWSTNCVLNLW